MRFVTLAIGLALAFGLSAGCGKSEAEKQAEQIEQAAKDMEKAADALGKAAEAGSADAAKGMEQLAKAMGGMAAAMNDGKPVDPVGFKDLETALPQVSGWTMETPEGERMTSPVPFSQVEANYTRGGTTVEVKIVDSGFNQMLMAPWSMFLATGYEKETSDGYEKAVTLGGSPGFARWDKNDKRGELNLVVAKRFLVTFEGQVDDMKVLEQFASNLKADRLAGMK